MIEDISKNHFSGLNEYSLKHTFNIKDSRENIRSARLASDTIREAIPPIKENLEMEFRKIMGVIDA